MEKEMGFLEAVSQVIRKSFVFNGRARRKEYWSWVLFSALLNIVVAVAAMMISSTETVQTCVSLIMNLLVFFPTLSVAIRRLHDVERSGWWYGGYYIALVVYALFGVILVAGSSVKPFVIFSIIFLVVALCWGVAMLVWSFTEGTNGPNMYGEDPKRD